jgi:hypothetical protein
MRCHGSRSITKICQWDWPSSSPALTSCTATSLRFCSEGLNCPHWVCSGPSVLTEHLILPPMTFTYTHWPPCSKLNVISQPMCTSSAHHTMLGWSKPVLWPKCRLPTGLPVAPHLASEPTDINVAWLKSPWFFYFACGMGFLGQRSCCTY